MIRAFGALDEAFTSLTLAVPVQTQSRNRYSSPQGYISTQHCFSGDVFLGVVTIVNVALVHCFEKAFILKQSKASVVWTSNDLRFCNNAICINYVQHVFFFCTWNRVTSSHLSERILLGEPRRPGSGQQSHSWGDSWSLLLQSWTSALHSVSQTRRRSICMVQIWHLLDCFLCLYQWDTLSTQEAKKGWFLTCCGSSKAKPRSLPGRKKKQWSNKRKKGERHMSNFAINHQLHMYYITTTIGIIKLSSVKYWDSTIFREGNLALVQIQVASNGVMHGKLLQRGQTTKRITFTL